MKTNTFTRDFFPETLLVLVKNGQSFTTSRKIAEHFKKSHWMVLRAYENRQCTEEFSRNNFVVSERPNKRGRIDKIVEVTRDGFMFLAMGFTGKEAAKFKEDFINAFNAMEAYINAEKFRHAAAFGQLKPNLLIIEAGDQQGLSRAAIAQQTGHKCLGSITAGRKRARALGLWVKPARQGGAA
jgi:Rha family phage regulatory protein